MLPQRRWLRRGRAASGASTLSKRVKRRGKGHTRRRGRERGRSKRLAGSSDGGGSGSAGFGRGNGGTRLCARLVDDGTEARP